MDFPLKGTIDVCLEFGKENGALTGYVDLDFVGDLDKRRSLTSYVFIFVEYAISWKSTFQSTVALSSTEAIKEAI